MGRFVCCSCMDTYTGRDGANSIGGIMKAIEPFWETSTMSEAAERQRHKRKKAGGYTPIGAKSFLKASTVLLEECLDNMDLHCGISFKQSFFFSIKDNINNKEFRNTLEGKGLVHGHPLLTGKGK